MLCAAARMQACLNLVDPATFPLFQQLTAPPLSAVLQSAQQHAADGTAPTPQAQADHARAKDYSMLSGPSGTGPISSLPASPCVRVQNGKPAHGAPQEAQEQVTFSPVLKTRA